KQNKRNSMSEEIPSETSKEPKEDRKGNTGSDDRRRHVVGPVDDNMQDVENMKERLNQEQLEGFELYGWNPVRELPKDTNWMDLCMLVTRNSKLRQGSMGCILVRSKEPTASPEVTSVIPGEINCQDIISAANNMSLYFHKKKDSDIHAEIVALGKASRTGRSTQGARVYITMPPCKRCFAALVAAGIERIVSRHDLPPKLQEVAIAHGISYSSISKEDMAESQERIHQLVQNHHSSKKKRKEAPEENGAAAIGVEAKKEKASDLNDDE
ncbi:MAG: hypothetical protein SGILL_008232, partial [Bacillariaceae sp.]